MDTLILKKPWYKSKTILSIIVIFILGIYNTSAPFVLEHYNIILPLIPEWIYSILAILGIKFRMDAKIRIGK